MDEFFFDSTSQSDALGMSDDELVAFINSDLVPGSTSPGGHAVKSTPPNDFGVGGEGGGRPDYNPPDGDDEAEEFNRDWWEFVDAVSEDPDNAWAAGEIFAQNAHGTDLESLLDGSHWGSDLDHPERFSPPPPQYDPLDCRQEHRAYSRNKSDCFAPTIKEEASSPCEESMLPSAAPPSNLQITLSTTTYHPPEEEEQDPFGGFVIVDTLGADILAVGPHGITYAATDRDIQFLTVVWNFLVENVDIAEWVVCLAVGQSNLFGDGRAECIRKRLTGEARQKFVLTRDLPWSCPSTAGACTPFSGNTTHILITTRKWVSSVNSYFSVDSDSSDRLCVVAAKSAVILHEILHGCLPIFTQNLDDWHWPWNTNDAHCGCDTPDMVESAFAWAVAQRYPCLTEVGECSFMGDDCMWMNPCEFSWNSPPGNCKPRVSTIPDLSERDSFDLPGGKGSQSEDIF